MLSKTSICKKCKKPQEDLVLHMPISYEECKHPDCMEFIKSIDGELGACAECFLSHFDVLYLLGDRLVVTRSEDRPKPLDNE